MSNLTKEAAVSRDRKNGRIVKKHTSLMSIAPYVGIGMIGIVIAFVLMYPLLPIYDPYAQHLDSKLLAPGEDARYLLGTDPLGRDVASRLALAGRVTLSIVAVVVLANAILGMIIGVLAGYFGGRVDNVLMAGLDIQLAMPMILVLTALATVFGPSIALLTIVLSITYWMGYARVARSTSRSLRDRDFVLAPMLQGASTFRVLRHHVLPNVSKQMLIMASSDIGAVILLVSAFDYLGLGVQAPLPSWGAMISESQLYFRTEPWLAILPGFVIFLTVSGVNLFSQRFTGENSAASFIRSQKAK